MRDEIEAVQNSGNYLLALINDILDLSKIEAGRMELDEINFDHQGLIKELSAMFEIRWQKKDSQFPRQGSPLFQMWGGIGANPFYA